MFCENSAHHMVVFIKSNQRNDNQKSVTRTEFIPVRYMIYVVRSNDDFFNQNKYGCSDKTPIHALQWIEVKMTLTKTRKSKRTRCLAQNHS